MTRDVVVIGGGLSGLTAAVLAAQAGRGVTLVERSGKLGGRARSVYRQGSVLNIGPHALYRQGHALAVLRRLGIDVAGGVPPIGGVVAASDGLHDMPASLGLLLKFKLLTARSKLVFGGLMGTLPRRRLWSYVDCPDRLDAGAMLRQGQIGLGGVVYVHGGWQRLVDQLRDRAQAAGVTIGHGAVDRIEMEGRAVAGVTLATGERIDAAAVIAAVPPAEARRLLGPDRNGPVAWPDSEAAGVCQLPRRDAFPPAGA